MNNKINLWFWLLIILALWITAFTISLFFLSHDKIGVFGDSFGAINSLFSGLALFGIIYTILLQKKELGYQRNELELTRKELKETRLAHEKSNDHFLTQLRVNNMPIFTFRYEQVLSPIKDGWIVIESIGKQPAYDISVTINYYGLGLHDYYMKNTEMSEEDQSFFNENEEISRINFVVSERGSIPVLNSKQSLKIPNYFKEVSSLNFFINYRDGLGNNYIRLATFGNSFTLEKNEMHLIAMYPEVPMPHERIDILEYKEQEFKLKPKFEFVNDFISEYNHSFYLNIYPFNKRLDNPNSMYQDRWVIE